MIMKQKGIKEAYGVFLRLSTVWWRLVDEGKFPQAGEKAVVLNLKPYTLRGCVAISTHVDSS